MRDVGNEPAVLALRSLEPRDGRRQGVGHPVELRGESRELVGAAGGDARREVATGDARGRSAAEADGAEDPPGDEAGRRQREGDGDERRDDQPDPELDERRLDRVGGKDEIEVRVRSPHSDPPSTSESRPAIGCHE